MWVGGSLEKHAGKFMVRLESGDLQSHHGKQTRLQPRFLFQHGERSRQMFLMQALIERLNQMLLRTEIVIRIAERDTRLVGNRAHRCPLISALAKQIEGSIKYQRAGLLALRSLGVH